MDKYNSQNYVEQRDSIIDTFSYIMKICDVKNLTSLTGRLMGEKIGCTEEQGTLEQGEIIFCFS